ncbi:LytR/AlgR family response regulator transcription factor, partial [Blautia wexlerae]
MLEIAICDDDAIILKTLGKYFGKLNDATIKYDIYNSADTLYRYVEEQGTVYDVFILDIEMQGMNGLELAQKIREKDSNCLIIFLTNYSQYVFSVFEVITFDFLRKPLEYSEFENLIKKIKRYFNITKGVFVFSYRKNSFSIPFEEIYYIEKSGRRAYLYSKDKEYIFNMTLNEIWKQLDSGAFVAIYPSCIVNLFYVREIVRDELILKTGDKLFVSKKY